MKPNFAQNVYKFRSAAKAESIFPEPTVQIRDTLSDVEKRLLRAMARKSFGRRSKAAAATA